MFMNKQLWIEEYFRNNKNSGKSKKGLAGFMRIDPARITNIINGSRKVSSHEIKPMAHYFGLDQLTVLSLLNGENINVLESPKMAPLISWVAAGQMEEACDPYSLGEYKEMINTTSIKSTIIALAVTGSSMNKIAPEGSTIVVDYEDRELVNGKYYVVRMSNENTASFKRFKSNPIRFEPYSTEDHETIYPQDGMNIVGRVVEVIHKL